MSAVESMGLTGSQRRRLRGLAQRLEPVLRLGREGLNSAWITAMEEALARHELVKVRLAGEREERALLARELAARTGSEWIASIGHMAVFYRPPVPGSLRKVDLGD